MAEEICGTNPRIRANISLTAKGFAQWDITSEAGSVEEMKKNLSETVDAVRSVLESKGIKEVPV